MRWSRPEHLAVRTRSGFLWLPRTAQDETRWLERATWVEVFYEYGCTAGSAWVARDWLGATPTAPEDGEVETATDEGGERG